MLPTDKRIRAMIEAARKVNGAWENPEYANNAASILAELLPYDGGYWQPISKCPADDSVFFAGYNTASAEAIRNGSLPGWWSYGQGSKIIGSPRMKPIYTGILGGNPSHWMPCEPPQ